MEEIMINRLYRIAPNHIVEKQKAILNEKNQNLSKF
jgi:hypothetical protein